MEVGVFIVVADYDIRPFLDNALLDINLSEVLIFSPLLIKVGAFAVKGSYDISPLLDNPFFDMKK